MLETKGVMAANLLIKLLKAKYAELITIEERIYISINISEPKNFWFSIVINY